MAWTEEQLLTGSLIVMFTTVMLAVQWYQSRLENDLVIEAAKRTQPHRRGTIDRAVQVPSEVWPRVIQHLTVQHLCMAQEVCSMFDQLSSCDKLWEAQCLQRWAGKQRIGNSLFPYADYSGIQLTKDECLTVLRARGVDTYRLRLPELQTAILSTPSWCSARMYGAERVKSKWKRSYFCAELDSHRQHISSAEVSHFRWQLVYHGQPSRFVQQLTRNWLNVLVQVWAEALPVRWDV